MKFITKFLTKIDTFIKSAQSTVVFEQAEEIAKYIIQCHQDDFQKRMNKNKGLRIIKKANVLKLQANSMKEKAKRLEIIKSSIDIEDEEVIELQMMKLQKLDIDDDVKAIVANLEAKNYAKAMKDIEAYLARYSGVVKYIDNELQGLRLELKSLESRLQELVEEKTEYLNNIEEFNREYNLHLGELIQEILNLKKEILYKKTIKKQLEKAKYQENIQTFEETIETIEELKSTISELQDALESIDKDDENYDELSKAYNELQEELGKLEDELKLQEEEIEKTKKFIEDESIENEYEEVKAQYDEYKSQYEHTKEIQKNIIDLSDDEKIELKKLYKKAARLCHPDIVPDELKEKAHKLMQELNEAYSKQDLKAVKKILASLENGSGFELSSQSIEDKELLKQKIEEYRQNIKDIEKEIEAIKQDDTYHTIVKLNDWDEYFDELKSDLEKEKERLEKEAREVLEGEKSIETTQAIKEEQLKKENRQTIIKENSQYTKHIQSIENIRFEKIRKYCENLSKSNQADNMQKYLAQNGKMYKALIYDALEVFISQLDGQTITVCDWGCGQGIVSMLVLDYIKEKQLDIKVSDVILIDDDTKALSRALAQVEALAQNDVKFILIKSDNNDIFDKIKSIKNNRILHIFANDNMPVDFLDIGYEILDKDFVLCVSNENQEFVDMVYENFKSFTSVQDVSIKDARIGRFEKFERIFKIDIDDDIIPF